MEAAVNSTQAQLAIIEKKHTARTQPSEYERYLQSPRWRTLARAVRMRGRGKCEICLPLSKRTLQLNRST
jgi:hypothetical protein